MDEPTDDVAMQSRCINCHQEQYGPAVLAFSHGRARCRNCGHVATVMTRAQWHQALLVSREDQQRLT